MKWIKKIWRKLKRRKYDPEKYGLPYGDGLAYMVCRAHELDVQVLITHNIEDGSVKFTFMGEGLTEKVDSVVSMYILVKANRPAFIDIVDDLVKRYEQRYRR